VKTGVQIVYNHSKILDSGFRRNDGKTNFKTFYEINNFPADSFWVKKIINSFWSKVDRFARSPFGPILVIPAKAGIQLIRPVLDSCSPLPAFAGASFAGTSFAGVTAFPTFYKIIKVDLEKSIYKILATGRISGQNINGSGGENIRGAIAKR
jgi:hypothetical protein